MVLGPPPAAQCHLTSLVLHVLQGNAEQWMEGPGPRSFAEPDNTYQQGGTGDEACGNADWARGGTCNAHPHGRSECIGCVQRYQPQVGTPFCSYCEYTHLVFSIVCREKQ